MTRHNTPYEDGYALLMALAVARDTRLVDLVPDYVTTFDAAEELRTLWADLMNRLEAEVSK